MKNYAEDSKVRGVKKNNNKQVRLDALLAARVQRLVEISGLAESDILRLAIRTGLPKIESGEVNPFKEGFGAAPSDALQIYRSPHAATAKVAEASPSKKPTRKS